MRIPPKSHFTDTISKIKSSLDDSRIEIHNLKKLYEEISLKRELTPYELKNLEHIDRIDELLMEFIPKIKFYRP